MVITRKTVLRLGISWSLNALIIETCEDHDIRKWYVRACLKNGWSKQQLVSQITEKAHENATLELSEDQSQFENQVALENEETVRVERGMPYTMGNLYFYASKDCLKAGISHPSLSLQAAPSCALLPQRRSRAALCSIHR